VGRSTMADRLIAWVGLMDFDQVLRGLVPKGKTTCPSLTGQIAP
jgi:hypothetical protein